MKKNIENNAELNVIKERQVILEKARSTLKKEYVCLDDVIDRVIDSISLWYIDSSLLERAPIVNLWGPTGTGKTSLIKRLVNLLGLDDVYKHISMISLDKEMNSTSHDTFQELLFSETDINNKNNVIMLDEFQWFYSKGKDGSLERQLLPDIWDFFSEREIKRDILLKSIHEIKKKLDNYVEFEHFISDYNSFERNRSKAKNMKFESACGFDEGAFSGGKIKKGDMVGDICTIRELSLIRKIYFPDMSRKELSMSKAKDFLEILSKKIASKDLFKDFSCKNYLIIVSGNLDEAYPFCKDASDYDFDADYYHDLSKKVDVKNVKKSLQESFRNEHIARMGNIHIMFPTLNKHGYKTIIDRYSSSLLDSICNKHKVSVTLSDNVKDMIYRNSIFPTQGVRPVFTSINDFINSNVSKYILEALINGIKKIYVDYDKNNFISYCEALDKKIFYIGDIDKIRKEANKNIDAKILASVHEAGHSIVFSILNHVVPSKIVVASSNDYYGLTFVDNESFSLKQCENEIMTSYGGIEAEKIIFGEDNIGVVSIADIQRVTEKLSLLARNSGIYNNTNIVPITSPESLCSNTGIEQTNILMESLSVKYREKVRNLLSNNIGMLVDLSELIFNSGHLEGEDIKHFFNRYGFNFSVVSYDNVESEIKNSDFMSIFKSAKEKYSVDSSLEA